MSCFCEPFPCVGTDLEVIAATPGMEVIDCENKGYFGSLPSVLGAQAGLHTLLLASNELTGTIPTELGQLFNLTILDVSANQLIGGIPNELSALADLRELDLSQNELSGELPELLLDDMLLLARLDVRQNGFSGEIPRLGSLLALTELQLGNNDFTGGDLDLRDLLALTSFGLLPSDFCRPEPILLPPTVLDQSLDSVVTCPVGVDPPSGSGGVDVDDEPGTFPVGGFVGVFLGTLLLVSVFISYASRVGVRRGRGGDDEDAFVDFQDLDDFGEAAEAPQAFVVDAPPLSGGEAPNAMPVAAFIDPEKIDAAL